MADRCYRLSSEEECAHEIECLGLRPHGVRIDQATGDHQGVEIVRICLIQRDIDRDLVAFVGVIHPLDLTGIQGNDAHVSTRILERFLGLRQLHLLEAIRREDRHVFVQKSRTHTIQSYDPAMERDGRAIGAIEDRGIFDF